MRREDHHLQIVRHLIDRQYASPRLRVHHVPRKRRKSPKQIAASRSQLEKRCTQDFVHSPHLDAQLIDNKMLITFLSAVAGSEDTSSLSIDTVADEIEAEFRLPDDCDENEEYVIEGALRTEMGDLGNLVRPSVDAPTRYYMSSPQTPAFSGGKSKEAHNRFMGWYSIPRNKINVGADREFIIVTIPPDGRILIVSSTKWNDFQARLSGAKEMVERILSKLQSQQRWTKLTQAAVDMFARWMEYSF